MFMKFSDVMEKLLDNAEPVLAFVNKCFVTILVFGAALLLVPIAVILWLVYYFIEKFNY